MASSSLAERSSEHASASIACRVAASLAERAGAYRLVHDAYVRSELIQPHRARLRITPYQLLPTTECFVAVLRDEVICTVSLVGDGELGLPLESIYPELAADRRRRGRRIAEVSALADRRADIKRFFPVFLQLIQVMLPYSCHHGYDEVLIAVHPRHARFYQRYLKFQVVGEERAYPAVRNHPAIPLLLDYAWLREAHPKVFQDFVGRDLREDQLLPSAMSDAERMRWRRLAQSDFDAPGAGGQSELPQRALDNQLAVGCT